MPPASARKTRARKVVEPTERSDFEDASHGHATPSRKRRRINDPDNTTSPNGVDAALPAPAAHARPGRKPQRNGDIQVFEDEHSFADEEPEINVVIRGLRTAAYDIQARVDYANEVQEAEHPEGKAAYAKIAGNGWTFYVEDLEIRIGRPAEARDANTQPTAPAPDDKSLVHIDLGPSKHVSRQHAEIRYDAANDAWLVHVLGRNGIKLDERPIKRGEAASLHCGSVIDIADTQMVFVTPNVEPDIHPAIRAQTRAALDDEDDEDLDMRPPQPATRTPTRAPGDRSSGARPPSSANNGGGVVYKRVHGVEYSVSSSRAHEASGDARMPSSVSKGGKTSPAYSRAMLLDDAGDIDYAQDSAKDLKPPHSYAQLIGMAILSSSEEKLTLSKIYDWIKERYAFYRLNGGGWQNSIRHNLSLNKCFEKIARRTDEPGKGMKWQIVPEHREDFIKKGLSAPRRGPARGSSLPNSPNKEAMTPDTVDKHTDSIFTRDTTDSAKRNPFKTSPGSTPPVANYPMMKQSFTPDRAGAKFFADNDGSSPRLGGYAGGVSPFPLRVMKREGFTDAAAAGSPGGPSMLLGSDPDTSLVTPLISRHAPKLAPPSTARLPSQYMAFSSPAPFWKYADFGSTPARPHLGTSPVKFEPPKTERDMAEDSKIRLSDEDVKERVRSSSPPLPEGEIGRESPTKSRGLDRIPTLSAGSHSRSQSLVSPQQRHWSPPKQQQQQPPQLKVAAPAADDDEDEEVGMIDLARGFQPIGSFHRNMSAGAIGGP